MVKVYLQAISKHVTKGSKEIIYRISKAILDCQQAWCCPIFHRIIRNEEFIIFCMDDYHNMCTKHNPESKDLNPNS